jgi:hypothetical protein
LRQLFRSYAQHNKAKRGGKIQAHGHSAAETPSVTEHITMEDVKQMAQKAKIELTEEQFIHIFSQSKQVVIFDVQQSANYLKMVYVEFLECLCRMALELFEPSEMKDVPLAQKLGFTLKSLFVEID